MTQLDAPPGDMAPPVPAGDTAVETRQDRRKTSRRSTTTWLMGSIVVVLLIVGAVVIASGTGSASSKPAALPPAASATAPAGMIVVNKNMPDPFVLVDGSTSYLYTGGYGRTSVPHVPVRPFTNLNNLGTRTDAMPTLPAWSWGWIWTEDVDKTPTGYVMWFTSVSLQHNDPNGVASQCIGEATSTSPLGPFTAAAQPAICQAWGSIDPRMFTDTNGQKYLLWKEDTNADTTQIIPTPIYSQKLASDGTTLEGNPVQMAVSSQPWEAALIESPDLVLLGGHYYLFFSGNQAIGPANGIGLATCSGPQGPCSDSLPAAFLASNTQGQGPGEESLYQQHGVTWLLYSPNAVGGKYLYRPLAVARVSYGPKGPYLSTFDGAVPG